MKQKKILIIYTLIILILTLISNQLFAANGGDVIGRHIYGLARDFQGDPLLINNDPLIYKNSSYDQTIEVDGSSFLVSLFDDVIGSIYVSEIDIKNKTLIDTASLSLEKINGISRPSSAFKSPWNSIIFSENQSINYSNKSQFVKDFELFFKNKSEMVKPYNYGWVSEIIVLDKSGKSKVIKNYAMGRLAASHIVSMPDNKTYYILDADHSGNLYVFISSDMGSLAKGNLYSVSQKNGDLQYNLLGKTPALKMKFKLKKSKFNVFFDSVSPQHNKCNRPYKYINTVYGEECLRIKPKNKKYIGQFEPIRMVALSSGNLMSKDVINISFDLKNNQLVMTAKNKTTKGFSLVKNAKMKSNYIAKVTP